MENDKSTPGGQAFWLHDWYVDPASGRISREGAEVKLEPKVMTVLELLASQPGEVFSREALEAKAWEGLVVSYDALSTTIIKLRKALGDDSRNPRFIETVSKKGYRLVAPVSYEGKPQAPAAAVIPDQDNTPRSRWNIPIIQRYCRGGPSLAVFYLAQGERNARPHPFQRHSLVGGPAFRQQQ